MKNTKRLVTLLLTLVMLVSVVSVTVIPASAASNPYEKWQNVDGDSYSEVRCTWYAWQEAYDNLGIVLPGWGNAGTWLTSAKNAGYETGTTAKSNSIAVWQQDGSYGHVAYVTSVSGSTMKVDEGGRTDLDNTSSNGVATNHSVSSKVGSSYDTIYSPNLILKGFIYLDGSSSTTNTLTLNFHVNGGKISSDTYKSSSSYVCTSDGSKFGPKYYYNQYIDADYGLYNASSFGLTRTGYKFVGWSTSKSGGTILKEDDTTLRTSDITSKIKDGSCTVTLYAQWEPNTLRIIYNANGGTIDSDKYALSNGNICYATGKETSYKFEYNDILAEKGLYNASTFGLSRIGYTFTGWSTSKSGGTVFDEDDGTVKPTDVTSKIKDGDCTVTLYAQWKKNKMTMYYHTNGGTVDSSKFTLGSDGYIYNSVGDKAYIWYSYNSTLDNFTSYDANYFGISKKGYTLNGWSTSKENGKLLGEHDVLTNVSTSVEKGDCTVTLYAQWKKNTVVFNYNANGGTDNSSLYATLDDGTIVKCDGGFNVSTLSEYDATLAESGMLGSDDFALSRPGYRFMGWSTSKTSGNLFYDDSSLRLSEICPDVETKNCRVTLYAQWEKVQTLTNGVIKDPTLGWIYVRNGGFASDYTGIQKNENGWWRIVNGKVDFSATGVYQNELGWWYCKDGKVQFNYTGIQKNSNGWWRIENGKVNFSATGVYQNELGWWYCKDGKVQFNYTGIKNNANGWWRIENGKVNFSANGVYQNENGWWKVENGKVNFGFTGIAQNSNGKWYCKDGKVDFSKNGRVYYSGKYYTVKGGKVV